MPPHARTAQAAAAAASHSSPNTNDVNSRGSSTSNRPNLPGQVGSNGNPYYNQASLQYQFRPFVFPRRPTFTDESNSNNNDSNSNNDLPQQNNTFESWTAFVNAAELGAGIPSFFRKLYCCHLNTKIN